MALITKTNITELVQIYYELRQKKTDTVKEKCQKMYEMHVNKNPIFSEILTECERDAENADDNPYGSSNLYHSNEYDVFRSQIE